MSWATFGVETLFENIEFSVGLRCDCVPQVMWRCILRQWTQRVVMPDLCLVPNKQMTWIRKGTAKREGTLDRMSRRG